MTKHSTACSLIISLNGSEPVSFFLQCDTVYFINILKIIAFIFIQEIGIEYMYVCVCSIAQPCLILCDPMDCCSLSAFSVHGIFQARILERVAMASSRGSF